jgi:thioredoxin 1
MGSDNVLEFTDGNFKEDVLESPVPVLVDFWAEWCMPCKMIAPVIAELADDYAGKIKIGKMDCDSNRDIPLKFSVSAIPTLILFKEGKMVRKFVGLQHKTDLKAVLDEVLAA